MPRNHYAKHFQRKNPKWLDYQTSYQSPSNGWTVIDVMDKNDDLVEVLEKHAIQKTTIKKGGYHGYTIIEYCLPILGIPDDQTTKFLICSPINSKRYPPHNRPHCGICRSSSNDINRTLRRNEMTHLKKEIAASGYFDDYVKFDCENRWAQVHHVLHLLDIHQWLD